jgi:hypothetical protein
MLTLTNSTISGNSASNGGGIDMSGGRAVIKFCTIYGNKTPSNGGGLSIQDGHQSVDGKNVPSQVSISNSITAANHASTSPDISGTLTSDGYNLIQNVSGVTILDPNQKHATDRDGGQFSDLKIDPKLQQNAGRTLTHALLPGSPLIDKIPLDVCRIKGISTDQRGVRRPQGKACDIGAYEYVSSSHA